MAFFWKKIFWLFLLTPYFTNGQEIFFSVPSGFYTNDFVLDISSTSSFQIRYTLDGHNPTAQSPIFTNPILVEERNSAPNSISEIPTNPSTTSSEYIWKTPLVKIPKMRIIKAALFNNNIQSSEVFYEEYFIGEPLNEIGLPIFSIISDSVGLFGYEEGIYVPGKDYDDDPDIWQPGNYFNRGNDWEKIAGLSFYENKNKIFRQNVSMRMHGGASRVMPCKSIRLAAKNSLGNEYMEYPFFEDRSWEKYKRILLRNSGQDFNRSLFADVLIQSLLKNQNVDYQASRQVVVFINGSYWGIHNLREKYDKYYFKNYHEGDLEAIDYMEIAMQFIAKEGSAEDYELMNESLLVLDLTDNENYDLIAKQIDIESFINHHISKIYGGGNDWAGNNERAWRTHEAGSKWRWLANDYDDIFIELDKDSYLHASRTDWIGWPNPEWSTRLFRTLMTNELFAIRYKKQLKFHLENTYSPANVQFKIDSLANIYRQEMPRHIERWNYPNSMTEWENTVESFKVFAAKRPAIIWQNFLDYFPNIYENSLELKISPNPANDFLYLDLPKSWSGNVLLQFFQIDGRKIYERNLSNKSQNEIPLSNFQNGVYLIVISDEKQKEIHKLVIAK